MYNLRSSKTNCNVFQYWLASDDDFMWASRLRTGKNSRVLKRCSGTKTHVTQIRSQAGFCITSFFLQNLLQQLPNALVPPKD